MHGATIKQEFEKGEIIWVLLQPCPFYHPFSIKEFRLYKDHGGEFHFPGLDGLHLPPPPQNPKLMWKLKETAVGCPC